LGLRKRRFSSPPDGIPWLDQKLETASTIYRDINLDGGRNRGFAYCYSSFRMQDQITKVHLPDYFERKFVTRVYGELVIGEEAQYHLPNVSPGQFYERDEYNFTFY
jgi:hypothetical protein